MEVLYEISTAPDLLIAARPGGIQVYSNDGSGIPTSPSFTLGSTDFQYKVLRFVDVDLDGYLDLVAAGSSDAAVDVYRNEGGALSEVPAWSSTDADYGAQDLAVGDFNADGFFDVVAVRFTDSVLGSLWVNQEGALPEEPSWELHWNGDSVGAVGAGDLDGDAMPELVVAYAGANVTAYQNLGEPVPPPRIDGLAGPMNGDDVDGIVATEGEGFELRVSGRNFREPVTVFVGEEIMKDVSVSPDTLTIQVPPLAAGRYDLAVVNPGLRAATATSAIAVADEGGNVPEDPNDPGMTPGETAAGCGCRLAGAGHKGAGGALLLCCLVGGVLVRRRTAPHSTVSSKS